MPSDTDPTTGHRHDADGASACLFPVRINTCKETKKGNSLQELGSVFYSVTQRRIKKELPLLTQLTGDCGSLKWCLM